MHLANELGSLLNCSRFVQCPPNSTIYQKALTEIALISKHIHLFHIILDLRLFFHELTVRDIIWGPLFAGSCSRFLSRQQASEAGVAFGNDGFIDINYPGHITSQVRILIASLFLWARCVADHLMSTSLLITNFDNCFALVK